MRSGHPSSTASSVMLSELPALASMFIPRGVFVTVVNTCRAMRPSIMRGTSVWPQVPRRRRLRRHRRASA